jgi:hypothetical protein
MNHVDSQTPTTEEKITMTTRTGNPAAARCQIYGDAVLRAAAELQALGADPVEVASGVIGAAVQLVVSASGKREVARQALIRAADAMLD